MIKFIKKNYVKILLLVIILLYSYKKIEQFQEDINIKYLDEERMRIAGRF